MEKLPRIGWEDEPSEETPIDSGNLKQLEKNVEDFVINILDKIVFPIGSTYITQEKTNPDEILGFGSWERLKGQVVVGLDEDIEQFDEIGKEGGEIEHTLTASEGFEHSHTMHAVNKNDSGYLAANGNNGQYALNYAYTPHPANTKGWCNTLAMGSSGGGQPHNNLQPYIVAGYMWIRTA